MTNIEQTISKAVGQVSQALDEGKPFVEAYRAAGEGVIENLQGAAIVARIEQSNARGKAFADWWRSPQFAQDFKN